MGFSFPYKVKPVNLWVLSLINIYRSMMGVVNIIFTASMILLVVRFWAEAGLAFRILMVAGILVFPVLQPLMIFLKSRKIVSAMPKDMRMDFDSGGMTISTGEKNSRILYKDFRSVIWVYGMLILYTQTKQGFILSCEELENRGQELYHFLRKKVKKQTN